MLFYAMWPWLGQFYNWNVNCQYVDSNNIIIGMLIVDMSMSPQMWTQFDLPHDLWHCKLIEIKTLFGYSCLRRVVATNYELLQLIIDYMNTMWRVYVSCLPWQAINLRCCSKPCEQTRKEKIAVNMFTELSAVQYFDFHKQNFECMHTST